MTDAPRKKGDAPFSVEHIRALAATMAEFDLTGIELSDGDVSLELKRGARQVAVAAPAPAPVAAAPAPSESDAQSQPAAVSADAVTAPMVGTVYLQAEPGARPFARVGDKVQVGDTLVIIEAMKVMNPIPSPRAGTVVEIMVADGDPVEYGEPLMIVE